MWPLHCISTYVRPGMAAMQNIATTTDDLEDRAINAAEIHGVHPKWAYGGGADPGPEGAF